MTPDRKDRWKRRARNVGLAILIIIGLPAAAHFYLRWSAQWELQRAVAETDRLDSGWRLSELESRRETLTDSENSALKVMAIKREMPRRWPNNQQSFPIGHRGFRDPDPDTGALEPKINRLAPEVQCSPEVIRLLRDDLSHMASVLPEARRLADFRHGRYPIEYSHRSWEADLVSSESLVIAKLLWADAILAAQDQQFDPALMSAIALLNTGRSIGDEPALISQSRRLAIQRQALLTIERILAQGQASAHRLEAVQRLLEEEEAEPLLLQAFRAERAGTYQHILAVFAGRWRFSLRFFHGRLANKLPLSWNRYIDMVIVRRAYPEHFRLLTGLVEAAKLPTDQQPEQIEELIRQAGQLPIEFQSWFESAARSAQQFHRNQAWLRCAVAALAVERYRLAHRGWPDSLAVLAPEFLSEIPTDPFDRQSLRFRRLGESVVIYSIGPDGIDNGGLVNRDDFQAAGFDVGFQLWDVSQRRQAWRPPAQTTTETEDGDDQTP